MTVSDVAGRNRYEARVGSALAGYVEYRARTSHVTLVHTEIEPAFEGQGIASRFVAAVLDDLRARERKVLPICPFIQGFIERHPEYAELVWRPAQR